MNWSAFFYELFRVANKYYLLGGLAFILFYWILRRRIGWKKIQAKFPRKADYWREIGFSSLSVVIFAVPPLPVLHSDAIRPHSTFYRDISEYGWAYFFLAFPLMILMHDTYFYWMHRLIHQPRLFKWIHLTHHRSTNPSPWAAYAFHPQEAVLESAFPYWGGRRSGPGRNDKKRRNASL